MSGKLERFRDPIHGFIYITEREKQIIDTVPVQRLRRIHQLALTHLIYPGAEHNRFAHSLGVMHLATQVFDALGRRSEAFRNLDKALKAHLRQALRLYALLHDLGHGPFSHAGDNVFPKGQDHESYSGRLIVETEVSTIINQIGDDLVNEHKDEGVRITAQLISDLIQGKTIEPSYFLLRQIMSSEADVDKMDYLLRDCHYCGVSYGQYDLPRLLESFVPTLEQATAFRLGIMEGGLHAFEAFVLARYWMFQQVYFHRTRRIFDYYLSRFYTEVIQGFPENIEEFLSLDDYCVWRLLSEKSKDSVWADAIINRRIWKVAFESRSHSGEGEAVKFRFMKRLVEERYGPESVFIDHAKKAPHKLSLSSLEAETAIPLVLGNGEKTSIAMHSEVIQKVVAPISKYRVYAAHNVVEDVRNFCLELDAEARGKN